MIYSKTGATLSDAYAVDGTSLDTAYDVNGSVVFTKQSGGVDYSSYTISNYCSVSLQPTQGFDIYNGVIFQYLANSSSVNNRMTTINAETSAFIVKNIVVVSDHGDSASFSNEFYSESDDYPLIYVTADTNPAKVYVNRVTPTTSELIRTLSFPLERTGYYAAACIDFENDIIYMVGYSENTALSDNDGSNKTVVSKWDMGNMTDNGDNTYTPAFISSYERPFIYVMQGQQYYDGMLWISSGGTNVRGYVYALDPIDGTLLYTVDSGTETEMEGIAFISPTEMVFGLQGGAYKKVTFASNA